MKSISFKDAVWTGIIAGIIFMMLEMLMVPVFMDGSPWGPPRMIAAIILGKEVLPPPASFDLLIFMAAVILHMILSIIYAIILAMIIHGTRASFAVSLLIGAVFGYLLYLINFYGMTAIFPWFAKARNWVSVVSHIIFGLAAAWAYLGFAKKHIAQRNETRRSKV